MEVLTVKYKVYKFSELNKEAKERAKEDYYDKEDYPFLSDDLTESLKALLEQYKITILDNLKLFYSLSYCQGDGLCFIGNFRYRGKFYSISHNYRYYFAQSVEIEETKEDENIDLSFPYNKDHPFIKLYLKICNELEKEGYGILDYRMDDKEFSEFCNDNGYLFLESGKLFQEIY